MHGKDADVEGGSSINKKDDLPAEKGKDRVS
jgi:hypothetical protein